MNGSARDEPGGGAFQRHRALWLASGLAESGHLAALAALLERSLESGSSAPAEAAARALGLCLLARGTISEGAARTIAFTGLDAGESDTAAYAAEREALLAVCVAEAHAGEDRRLDAMGMLRRARHALGRIEEPGPPAVYAAMLVARAEAELAEAGRDRMGAAQAFAECVAHAGTLLDRAADTEAIEGPLAGDVPERLVGTVERDAVHARVAGLLGRVRALVPAIGGGRGTASAEAAAHAVVAAIEAHGVPAGVAPLDIVETVIALTPADAALFARHVLRWVEGTSPGPARDWEAVLYAARAHGAMLRGDGEAGAALYERAGAVADDDVTPTVAAFVRGLDLLDNGDAEEELRAVIAEEFLIALSELANAEYGAAERPDARAEVLLEAPVAAAIAHVAGRLDDGDRDLAPITLGLLVDILREPRWQPVIPDLHLDPAERLAIAGQAWELALDRPGRILHALRTRPDTAVLVTQRVGEATWFILLRADDPAGLAVAQAGAELREALRALARADAGDTDGRRAFDALPGTVRTLLRTHTHILIVPDPRVQDGALAFQRMVDGTQSLRAGRVLEHAPSLRAAMRTLEPPHDAVSRMVDAFTEPTGEAPDRLTRFEAVRAALEADAADPRAAAALSLTLAMTRLDASEPREAEWAVERLIAAADELDHRPAGALLRAVRARMLARHDADDGRRLEAVEEALRWLEGMRTAGDAWDLLHRELGAERDALSLRVRMMDESTRLPAG